VADASQRKTFAGGTWRSAIAPNISGEMNAATAEAQTQWFDGVHPVRVEDGAERTNQIAMAAAWMKNKSSTRRIRLCAASSARAEKQVAPEDFN